MSIYQNWIAKAFAKDGKSIEAVWDDYLPKEQKIYEEILDKKLTEVKGTIKELAVRYDMTTEYAVAFVDGINDILDKPYKVDELDEDSQVNIIINFERLYKKMLEYKAEHLYTLKQWDSIFDDEKKKELFVQQRSSRTVVKEVKIGRNDPCPCGSGKKYKKCCGA